MGNDGQVPASGSDAGLAKDDAGAGDAGTDASLDGDSGPSDASTGRAGFTLSVHMGVMPVVGASVLLHDATGAVTARLTTDAVGHASSHDVASMVSILRTDTSTPVSVREFPSPI